MQIEGTKLGKDTVLSLSLSPQRAFLHYSDYCTVV